MLGSFRLVLVSLSASVIPYIYHDVLIQQYLEGHQGVELTCNVEVSISVGESGTGM